MASLSALDDYFGSFVHPAAAEDEVASTRHRTFILFHLCWGIAAFATLPLMLLARGGVPSVTELTVLAALVVPILAALDLSRTGNLERAVFTLSATQSTLVLYIAAMSGGLGSFALLWLPIAVFEAALSGSRRASVAGFGVAAFVLIALLALEAAHLTVAAPNASTLPEISALLAVVYAAGLAWRWDRVHGTAAETRRTDTARYQMMAEHAADLVTRHAENGAVIFASPAAERLLGAHDRDLHGRGLFERVHIGDRPAYLTAISQAWQGRDSVVRIRLRRDFAGEGEVAGFGWVEMSCRLDEMSPPAGRRHVVSVFRDVFAPGGQSRIVQTEAEMPDQTDRTVEAKGRFLASMSHELRTPLNAIIGFSEILASENLARTDPARQREYAELIRESGLHLLSVVNGILDMSRIESGNFSIFAEPFEMTPVVQSCVQMFCLKAESSSVRLSADICEDLPQLLADKRACKQILINLISNAIKFTPAGGDVRVSIRAEGEDILIEVTDTGIGISDEDLPFVGTNFFQARSSYDRPYDGTGLGLSVVKGLVALHGGSFGIDSELGKGTRVIVRLPRDPGESVPLKTSAHIYPAHSEKRAAIG